MPEESGPTPNLDKKEDPAAPIPPAPYPSGGADLIWGMKPNSFVMAMHLSILCGYIIPWVGLIAPIVLWLVHKDRNEIVDRHGKDIVNWLISFNIYVLVAWLLIFVFIGFIILPVLAILGIVFPILGAIKANEGTLWKYPLTITFFK
jgi:uncharacterized Tic20 family protein